MMPILTLSEFKIIKLPNNVIKMDKTFRTEKYLESVSQINNDMSDKPFQCKT